MRARFAVIATVAVLLLSGLAQAQPPDCTTKECIYLPIIEHNVVPTNTATATSTHTATAEIPTNTPTTRPSGVFVLGNHSAYVDSIDYLHVVGEVENNTGQARQFVKITANFFNASQQLIDTDFTFTSLDELRPGEKTCFHLLLEQPPGWASYQFEGVTSSMYAGAFPALTVLGDSGSLGSFNSYRIIGQVRNDGAGQVKFVQPVATLYNAGGTVIGCDFTFVSSTDLDPGQTSSFDLSISGRQSYTDVASYRLQVDGNLQ